MHVPVDKLPTGWTVLAQFEDGVVYEHEKEPGDVAIFNPNGLTSEYRISITRDYDDVIRYDFNLLVEIMTWHKENVR